MRSVQVVLWAASFLAVAGSAAAADTVPATSADAATPQLAEIVVTAQHRKENLQTVPIAMTAITGKQMLDQHVDNFADIVGKVPGFLFNPDNITQPNLFMRGIGTDIRTSASNPGVAIYVDDVYLTRDAALYGDLWDLQRVEVLEGPQGVLFGKNAVGGVVNFVTLQPGQTPYATAELTLGNYGAVTARGIVSGPLSNTVAGSFSFSSQTHDGYETNTLTGGKFDQVSQQTARGHLRFTPSDDLDVTLSGDVTRRRGTGPFIVIGYTTRNQAFVPPSPRAGPVSGPVCSNVVGEQFANAFGSGPLNGPLNCAPADGVQNVDDYGTSLKVDWRNALGKLTSITAYRHSNVLFEANDAGTSFDFAAITPFVTPNDSIPDDFYYQSKAEKVNQLSEEVRLESDANGPWSWITGLYFLHDRIDRNVIENFLFPDIFWFSGTSNVVGNTLGHSYGVFADGTYRWSNGLGLSLGGRYSLDQADWEYIHTGYSLTGQYDDGITAPQGFAANSSGRWDAFTPSAVVDWKAGPGRYYYFKIVRGYQSGGFGAEDTAEDPGEAVVKFKPEFALNYEAGAKYELLDRRLRIDPTIFWTDYSDLQIVTLVPGFVATDLISNAGKARSRGAELQITTVPVRGLQVYGNYQYLDCKITSSTPTTSVYGNPIDINGYTCRRAPRNSFNVGSRVQWGAGTLGSLFAQVDYDWTDRFYFDNDDNPISEVGAQWRLDGSFGLQSADGQWQLSVWGKNLTNQLLVSGRSLVVTPDCRSYTCDANSATLFNIYQPPRTYGVTVRWTLPH